MTRFLIAAYLLAHGSVHLAIYVMPPDTSKPPPFDPHRSWALSLLHASAGTVVASSHRLAWITAAAFTVAGAAVGAGVSWWPIAAVAAAAVGLGFKVIWFHPWLSAGVALDVALIAAAAARWPGSLY